MKNTLFFAKKKELFALLKIVPVFLSFLRTLGINSSNFEEHATVQMSYDHNTKTAFFITGLKD